MEIINMDAETFDEMLSKFEHFASRLETLCRLHGDKDLSDWMDNQEVCKLLNISPRTLQTLRDNETLKSTRIGNKMYYKPSDVNKIVPVVNEKRKKAKNKGKEI